MASSIFNLSEIITQIIQFLEIDSLYACLMVNRTWYSIVVPILWRYPFVTRWSDAHCKIVPVYISCLESDRKTRIKELCQTFPDLVLTNPTLDYVKYLRSFNFRVLHRVVKDWCNDQEIDDFVHPQDPESISNAATTILEFLIGHIMGHSNLKKLEISVVSRYKGDYINLEFHKKVSRSCLAKIVALECDDYIERNLIFASKVCTNLVYLKIECSWENDEIVSAFIRAQKNLKHLVVSKKWPKMNELLEGENLCNSLKTVELKNNQIDNNGPLCVLSALKNLEVLQFKSWLTYREEDIMELASTPFHRLQKLVLVESRFPPLVIIRMITVNGIHLQELTLHWERRYPSSHIIKTVTENCPNIRRFDAPVQYVELPELYQLLRSCKKLESLIINDSEDEDVVDVDHFLPVMGIIIPRNLYQLSIFTPWRFSVNALQMFLMETCQAQLTCMGFYKCIDDEHLEVIAEYASKKKTLCVLELRWCETTQPARKKARAYIKNVLVYNQVGRLVECQ
ncbi:9761_t:CDS:1 [Acaulospora morrowiae]|uniref:9761_t:CDS:1 n=1 Tax=Acaulospora morrowiae TaxID=94023 RepID=A0A9N9FE09_9GLOM|nr:9761_t:CDS:1 [Acaulospora morrowiae]